MPTPGRPKALDETQHGNVCELVAGGSSIRQAARYMGCAPSSIRREAARNEEFRRQLAMAKAEAAHTTYRKVALRRRKRLVLPSPG